MKPSKCCSRRVWSISIILAIRAAKTSSARTFLFDSPSFSKEAPDIRSLTSWNVNSSYFSSSDGVMFSTYLLNYCWILVLSWSSVRVIFGAYGCCCADSFWFCSRFYLSLCLEKLPDSFPAWPLPCVLRRFLLLLPPPSEVFEITELCFFI